MWWHQCCWSWSGRPAITFQLESTSLPSSLTLICVTSKEWVKLRLFPSYDTVSNLVFQTYRLLPSHSVFHSKVYMHFLFSERFLHKIPVSTIVVFWHWQYYVLKLICTSVTELKIHFVSCYSLYELQISPYKGGQVVLSTWATANTRPVYNSTRHSTVILSLLDTKRICEENRRSLLCFTQQKKQQLFSCWFFITVQNLTYEQRGERRVWPCVMNPNPMMFLAEPSLFTAELLLSF